MLWSALCFFEVGLQILYSSVLSLCQQSSLESEMESGRGEHDGFISIAKEVLQRFVQEHFPTTAVTSNTSQVRWFY